MIANRRPLVLCLTVAVLGSPAPGTLRADDPPANSRELGPLTGAWEGRYEYPADTGQSPVTFSLILIHEGTKVTGMIREPNTFGERPDPWLHATLDGRCSSREVSFTKSYDGTAGVSHDVAYQGQVSADGDAIENGTWTIPGSISGTFTLKRKSGSVR